MSVTLTPAEIRARESRSLNIAMAGSMFMGVAGVTAGMIANSDAIMMDGLFSTLGFLTAFLGKWVGRRLDNPPDKVRPWGYAAEESIFTMFRALSVVGLILFALANASMAIYAYAIHGTVSDFRIAPAVIYTVVVGATCFLIWFIHRRNWILTGRRSDILRLESKAAAFDGLLTAITGLGLTTIHVFRDGFLAPVAPVGDSLIVVILCAAVVGQFWKDFIAAMGELAGATAKPAIVARARRAARRALAGQPGRMRDCTAMKLGRFYWINLHYDPGRAVTADEVDRLQDRLTAEVRKDIPNAEIWVLITERSRAGLVTGPAGAGAIPQDSGTGDG